MSGDTERPLKIIVAGHVGSGKTTFVRTLSQVKAITTERKTTLPEENIIKPSSTVAFDFGTLNGSRGKVSIFGIPGQKRFSFMWEILARGTVGYVFMLDSSNPSLWMDTIDQIEMFMKSNPAKFVIAANKQDLKTAVPPEKIREKLSIPNSIPVLPCIALRKDATLRVLDELLAGLM